METTSMEGRILATLKEDAKALYAQIANRADVSKLTVWKYIRKLEDDGVITGYSTDIDPKELVEQSVAMVGTDTTSERYVEVTRILKELGSVEAPYISSGDHMLMAEVRAVDSNSLGDAISDETLPTDGVTAVHPSFLQERPK